MAKKLQIGDIFEIETELGLSYGQLTHRHPTHTDVLRIFKPKFKVRPENPAIVAAEEVEFTVLCTVGAGFRTGTMPRVGNCAVREQLQPFPKFRNGTANPETGVVEVWWIWDGENEVRVGKLSAEQMNFPRLAIRNLVSIKDLIEGKTHPALL